MALTSGDFSAVPGFIRSSRLVFVAMVVGIVLHAAVVHADPPPAAAREAAEQARQACDAGRWPAAIEAYGRAYELSGDTTFLFRLGEVNQKMGQDVAALRFYRTYVARDPRGKYREAAERAASALELKASTPASAAPAPAPARAVAPIRVAPPAPPTPIAPPAPPPAPPPKPASVIVPPPAPVPAPATELRADITATPAPSSAPLPTGLAWAGVGATVALGAGAIVTGLQASHRYDQLRSSCGRTAEGCASTDIDMVKSRARIANLLWAATGVTAAATGIIVIVNAREVGFAGAWSF
jgi:hypothetical protein